MDIIVEEINLKDAPLVQEIFESSPDYFRRTDRSEVLPHFALREMTDCVPLERQSEGYRKVFCLIKLEGDPVGIVDLHQNHPEEGKCYLGLLLMRGEKQKNGLGKIVYPIIEKFISDNLNCTQVVLGVSEDNDVEGFWQRVGFKRNGRHYIWKGEDHDNNVFEMDKIISP